MPAPKEQKRYSCVVVGASAGGVEALSSFFDSLKPTPSLFYVVALHISSKYPSALTEIIARLAPMPTVPLTDGVQMQGGHIYVAPPGVDVELFDGKVSLIKTVKDHRPHPDISKLFESFAAHFGRQMIAIVLSGTGSDGTRGAETVKTFGGTVLAQDRGSSKYSSMPESVENTGVVDFSSSPADLAKKVIELSELSGEPAEEEVEPAIDRVIKLVRLSKGLDFSLYKPGTIRRRILHRAHQVGLNSAEDYLSYLKSNHAEIDILIDTILISVTEFFRDQEVFRKLADTIAEQMRENPKMTEFRAWVAGCATGQEAYTVAMILRHLLPPRTDLRVFATDVDQTSVDFARRGNYPIAQLAHIPSDYHQYLKVGRDNFSVLPRVRDSILFSVHDILRDPPLIRQDLVSCRNLLIYLMPKTQERVLRSLAYSMSKEGLLLLGNSENLEESLYFRSLFLKEKIFKLYTKPSLESVAQSLRLSKFAPSTMDEDRRRLPSRHRREATAIDSALALAFGPPSILVTPKFAVPEVFGDLRPFIMLKSGPLDRTLENLFERELALLIKSSIIQARKLGAPKVFSSRVKLGESKPSQITLRVQIYDPDAASPMYLVSFLDLATEKSSKKKTSRSSVNEANSVLVKQLSEEADLLRNQLKDAIEDLESTNEELQSMNEELQSSNEELQSSNEELESTNEELRATNEELIVVNDQLRTKSEELDEFYTSLQLIEDTIDSSIILIDFNFNVLRTSSAAKTILKVQAGQSIDRFLTEVSRTERGRAFVDYFKSRQNFSTSVEMYGRIFQLSFLPVSGSRSQTHFGLIVGSDITELESERAKASKGVERFTAVLNSMDSCIALLDKNGNLVEVNARWIDFGKSNGIDASYDPRGKNYIQICRQSATLEVEGAGELADGIWQVLNGRLNRFSYRYPCHSPKEKRYFQVVVTPFSPAGEIEGCVINHIDLSSK